MKNNNIISPEKIYAMYSNNSSMEEKQDYEKLDISKIKDNVKKMIRGDKKNKTSPQYNYLVLSNSERINKISKFYKKLGKIIVQILKKNYQSNENKFIELSKKILNRVNNKIRTDKSGKIFITVGDKDYYGDIKGYEDLFVKNKLNFKRTFKIIVSELLNLLEKDNPEKGKSFILNNKKNIYNTENKN
jgi:hypothetical protein